MGTLIQAKDEILGILQMASGSDVVLSADQLSEPPDATLGDLAFGCFALAKKMQKTPNVIATDLSVLLNKKLADQKKLGLVLRVDATGPYLNFFLNINELATQSLSSVRRHGVRYGTKNTGVLERQFPVMGSGTETTFESLRNKVPGRRVAHEMTNIARGTFRAVQSGASKVTPVSKPAPLVMIEIGALNTHKEIHVGHLRNILLGKAAINLRRALGEQVIVSSYLGDSGAHVAKTLWALEKFHNKEILAKEKRGQFLGKVYTEASQYIEEHPEAKLEVGVVLQKLEAEDKHLTMLWKRTRSWSLLEIKSLFSEIGVPIRRYYFESEVEASGKKIVMDLLKKGIAKRSEGAVIIDLEDQGLGAFLVLKTDGTTLYATKDLALAKKKFSEYPLDASVVIVDSRQSLYFKQLFAALKKIGFTKPMVHLPYEFVTLKEGAMSSRKGNVVTYEDFRDEMIEKTMEETKKRHTSWSSKKIASTARDIAFGAMAIGMLKVDNDRQIIFDMEAALAFDGFTGPYLQYTLARIRGIAKKAKRSMRKGNKETYGTPEERNLVLDISRYPQVVEEAAKEYRPAKVVAFLFELAKHFAEFYEHVPVLKAPLEERAGRLKLVAGVGTVLEAGFHLLGIPVINEM